MLADHPTSADIPVFDMITNFPPARPEPPSGPSSGFIETDYAFSVLTADPEWDDVTYEIDWGDDTTSQQTNPSDTVTVMHHSWTDVGTYSVQVRAKDAQGIWSDWSHIKSISIGYPPEPEISLTGDGNFGTVTVGESRTKSFTLQNIGAGIATGNVTITGDGDFSIVEGDGPFELSKGETKTISVRFEPHSEGYKTATLHAYGDSPCNDVSADIDGTGAIIPEPVIELSGNGNFGTVSVGLYEETTFTLTNVGTGTATGTVDIDGSSVFTIVSGGGSFNLNAGASKSITVRFTPLDETPYQGYLVADGSNCNDVSVSLAGTGGPPPDPVLELGGNGDFGAVNIGDCENATFVLTNVGTGTANGIIRIEGPSVFSLESGGDSFSLDAGESKQIIIRFCPLSETNYSGLLVADGSNCDDVSINLSGSGGQPPELQLSGDGDFGAVALDDPKTKSFTLTNIGIGTARGKISIDGSAFSIISGGGSFSLGEGESRNIVVKFEPTSVTSYSGTLTADGSNCEDVEITLSGRGIRKGPDLDCGGNLEHHYQNTGEYILKKTIWVRNIGEPGSVLYWEIADWPHDEDGTWTFEPDHGALTPEDGEQEILVTINISFDYDDAIGESVKIINSHDPSDYGTIGVRIDKLAYGGLFYTVLNNIIKNNPWLEPLLSPLIQTLERMCT